MQTPRINRYLLSIHIEPVLKVFKHFNSLQVWSLGGGFWCLIISRSLSSFYVIVGQTDTVKVLIKIFTFSSKNTVVELKWKSFFLQLVPFCLKIFPALILQTA